MSTNTIIGAVVVVIVLVGGYFIFSQPAKVPLTQGPVKVGVILPLTGGVADLGEASRNVMQIAADKINAEGGIGGNQIQLIFEDGMCEGKAAANAMQKLVNVDKVQLVLGGACSGESIAAVPIATQGKVAMLSPMSSSPDLTGISPYFVRNFPSDNFLSTILATIAAERGYKKVAVLAEQSDYAQAMAGAYVRDFAAKGGTTVVENYSSDSNDLRTQLTRLRNEKPDALFLIPQSSATANIALTQITALGWKPALLVNDVTSGSPDVLTAHAALLENAATAQFVADKTNPKFAALLAEYQTRFGGEPTYQSYMQTAYDSVFLAADAVRAVGYDGTKIANWFHTSVKNWEGAVGSLTIGADGDPTIGHKPEVIRDGKAIPYAK